MAKEHYLKIESKLKELAKSVIHNDKYSEEFLYLFKKFNVTEERLIDTIVNYTLNLNKITNKDYASNAMRMVLYFHNLVDNSYHQKRQDIVIDFLKEIDPDTLIEIGFGTPSKYIFDLILKNNRTKLTLIDMDASAVEFAKTLLEYKNPEWKNIINFKIMNMNDQEFPGNADVYIFMDSVEHTKNPTNYLKKIVKLSPQSSHFIFSIPIAKIDTFKHMHYIEWSGEKDVKKWLNECGLSMKEKIVVKPNPKVDFFADLIEGGYYNMLVLADKK